MNQHMAKQPLSELSKSPSKDVKRQVADIVEMEGRVAAADAIRQCTDLSAVTVSDLGPCPQGTAADILARNPSSTRQTVDHVLAMRQQMHALKVNDRTVLISKQAAADVIALLKVTG